MSHFFSNPQNVLHLSSRVLGVGLVMLLTGVYGAYLYAGHLSIVALVSMHAMTILGPTLLKIGYVMRLLSQYGLSQTPARVVA
ncbi:transmembrane sensor/regulator PpyR [Pseudomonas jessenii]|uniref:transmembrane sensor/regulator PpyR n=1 Tax=Pseudomonas jessenii TaxID=77298 RepID=UPI0038915180